MVCYEGKMSYGGHCYNYDSKSNYTYQQAADYCADYYHSELLVIESEAESQFIKGTLKNKLQ